MDTIRQELKEIRLQSKADFEFMAGGLGDMSKHLRDMSERMAQIEGRMRLQDKRFDRMIEVVDQAISNLPTLDQIVELDGRVRALELRNDQSAA